MDSLTNQEFNYREVPVQYDGTGTLVDIKGNTISFNQLVENGNFADTSHWEVSANASFTVSNNEGTLTLSSNGLSRIRQAIDIVFNHKYYICATLKGVSGRQLFLQVGNVIVQPTTTDAYALYSAILTPTNNTSGYYAIAGYYSGQSGDVLNYKNFMVFDLTLMGIDNLTTTAEVESWLSSHLGNIPYFAYTQGSLISFNGTGLKTTKSDQTTELGTLSLPISTYFPTGMKSAGSVYDELTESKAITRIGSRAYQSGDEDDTSVITDGTTTYYALTTPTEIDISLDLTYPIENGGTEQILPVNTSVPATSPILCDIDYRTMIPVNATVDPTGSGTISGTGNYRYHSNATLTATPSDEIYRFLRWEDENGTMLSTDATYTFEVGE